METLNSARHTPTTEARNFRAEPAGWCVHPGLLPYEDAVAKMEAHVAAMIAGTAGEVIWLVEHPPLYTAGTSAKQDDLRDPERFPVHKTKRGGQYTYHGPGQRVIYPMLDLTQRNKDVRAYVADLERWIIATLAHFGVDGAPRDDRVGVWVDRSQPGHPREDKIAAIGVRLKQWRTFHGLALNVEPNLEHFEGITPCGIADPQFGVTSLVDLGRPVTMAEMDAAFEETAAEIFGPVQPVARF